MIARIITLDPADDASSAHDRIEWANADRIALVMPNGMRWRELDFAHLRRTARQYGAAIALISSDFKQRTAARETGLVAFANLHDAVNKRWLPGEEVEPIRRLTPPRRFSPNSLRRFFPRRNWFLLAGRALVVLITFTVMAAAVLSLLPQADITLTASSQSINTIVPVMLDPRSDQVNLEARTIPATRIDVIIEDRMSTNATGKRDIPQTKGRGAVTFSNVLATPYVVARNTVVRTTATSVPVRFVTLNDVEVPPGGRADATIEALEAGPNGNVGAGQINRVEGVPSLAVIVINAAPTNGGSNVTLPAVTEDDYKRLRSALRDKLLQEAAEKMKGQREVVNDGLLVLPETLFIADVQDETYDRFITEQADRVQLNMRIQIAGLAVSPRDIETVAREALQSNVPQGFELLSVETVRGEVAEEGTGNDALFFVDARGLAGAAINESDVKRLVRGKSISEAQAALLQNFSLKRNPQISASPDWLMQRLDRLPFVTLRINTTVERE